MKVDRQTNRGWAEALTVFGAKPKLLVGNLLDFLLTTEDGFEFIGDRSSLSTRGDHARWQPKLYKFG